MTRIIREVRTLDSGARIITYRCLDCLCHIAPDADHTPGGPACQAAAEERHISRSE